MAVGFGSFVPNDSFEVEEDELKSEELNERTKLLWAKVKVKFKSATSLKNLANAIFVLGVSFMCIQQCYVQIDEYLQYKEHIQVSHSLPSSAFWMIPGITICNNNRVRIDRIAHKLPNLVQTLRRITNNSGEASIALLPKRKRFELMKHIKYALEEDVNITALILSLPLSKLSRLSSSALIKDVNCNGLWGQQVNCENFRIVESYQSGPCYTLFYLGSVMEALTNGQAFDFNTSLIGGQRKINHFDSHELVEIFIDFEPTQIVDFQRDLGGKLIVHSSGHIGSIGDLAHSILPGNSYDLVLQRVFIKRLPPPYPSMCFDYKKANLHKFTKMEGSKGSVELDRTTCVRNCVIRRITKECHCWPIEVPFLTNDSIVANADTFKMCPWGSDETAQTNSVAYFVNCYKKNREICQEECRAACRTEQYKIHVLSRPWPTRDMFFTARNEEEQLVMKRLEACCSKISIRYLELTETRNIMYPSMTFVQLVSNLGGIVSALVGVSTLTVYRFITRKIMGCKVVNEFTSTNVKRRIRKRALIGAKLCKQVASVSPMTS